MDNCTRRKASRVFIVLLAATVLLVACGGTVYSRSRSVDTSSIVSSLMAQHKLWKGVPYRSGGQSKRGVDCSGFVQLTFRDRFHIDIPRSTKGQARYGLKVRRSHLRAGDLVFFRTGIRQRHVGIYIEDGKFLHASTSRGVMLSNLSDDYWEDHYWQARRVMR
jgi:cell wall-associated NlpC family hydrolase